MSIISSLFYCLHTSSIEILAWYVVTKRILKNMKTILKSTTFTGTTLFKGEALISGSFLSQWG